MTYEIWSDVWRSIPDVITAIKSVHLPGDLRYLEDTRTATIYPALIVRDPVIDVNGTEGKEWACEIAIVNIHGGTTGNEDTAMIQMYSIARSLIWLLASPELLGFGYGVEANRFRMEIITISADNALGWSIKFQMKDHDRMCDPDIDAVPVEPTITLLPQYPSDVLAIAGGLTSGRWYLLSENNVYGMQANIPKMID